MKYCRECILPNSRPNLNFDKFGVCDGCSKTQTKTNWKLRLKEFKKLVKITKSKKKKYDCLIPVSGGKDSTWQVITAKKYGLKPLCVTWRSPARNSLGQNNLNNLINLGVDHIDYSLNPTTEKKFVLKTFMEFGNPLIPMHLALHAIPTIIAIEKKIPLILWGENSAYEYGGPKKYKGAIMNNKWRKKFGVNEGKGIKYWVSKNINIKDLINYNIPSFSNLKKNKIFETWFVREELNFKTIDYKEWIRKF